MPRLLINIDVPDLDRAVSFYTSALCLSIGPRLGDGFVELLGAEVPIYLFEKPAGTTIGPAGEDVRRYERHWSPVHLDIVVNDMAEGFARVMQAGAVPKGRLVTRLTGCSRCSPIHSVTASA